MKKKELPTKTVNSVQDHVRSVEIDRMINGEYFRGFREGQHKAAIELAGCIDQLLSKYNNVAVARRYQETD